MSKIIVTSGAQSRNYRGIVLHRIPVRQRSGGFASTNVIGFCSDFSAKDSVKEFCNAMGGTWDGVERMWFVPLKGDSVGEVLANFWEIAQNAIAEFGEAMSMGGIHISVEMPLNAENLKKSIAWIEKQARIKNLGLGLVEESSDVAKLPTVRNIERQEDGDEDGRIRFVRCFATIEGQQEYVFESQPDNPLKMEVKSGLDSAGKEWFWLEGDKLIADGFRSDGHGWVRV